MDVVPQRNREEVAGRSSWSRRRKLNGTLSLDVALVYSPAKLVFLGVGNETGTRLELGVYVIRDLENSSSHSRILDVPCDAV